MLSQKNPDRQTKRTVLFVLTETTKCICGVICSEYDMNGATNNREDTPINFPLIRYADVLLMLAECYNQTDQQTKQST